MKKLISLSTILAISVLFFGCDIPLVTKYQTKRYLSKTEGNFQDSKIRYKDIKGYIFNSHGEGQNTAEIKKTIDDNFRVISEYSEKFNKTKAYSFTNNLSSGLDQYYEKVIDFSGDVQLMYKYFYLSEKTADDLINTAEKVPTNLSGSHTKLIKELTAEKKEYETTRDEISNETVPDYFYQAKVSLSSVLDAYVDYLGSAIKGLKSKNSRYLDVDRFVIQMDKGISNFSNQLIVIEKRGQFELRDEDIQDLAKEIDLELQNIKDKYKL